MESLSDLPVVTQLESSKDQNVCPGSNHPCHLPLRASWMFLPARPLIL